MKNIVVAISGYSGSGKTTVCEYIINEREDFIYFDFGFLFRALTYYLFNDLKLNENEIKKLIESNKMLEKINFSYKIENNKIRIGINNRYYSDDVLFTPKMNMDTITVGTLIGDRLTDSIRKIIDELKQERNVLLNARRPYEAYPNMDCHIFLKADFNTRLERKIKMNKEDYTTTRKKLLLRDHKEEISGFWQIFDFTKVIDTSNLTKEEMITNVKNIFDKKINNVTFINNLTLVLGSYECDKNCPYCIAKNNKKFSASDSFINIEDILNELEEYNVKMNRFVISGNGEPSLYSYEDLLKIKLFLERYRNLYNLIRIHSSGNIFFEEDKFNLFNMSTLPLEFEVLRVALDPEIDMEVLGYNKDYLNSKLFKNCNNIKCDIAFTNFLDIDNISEELKEFMYKFPNILKIRFKKLLVGDSDITKQAKWVKSHSLNDDLINEILFKLKLSKKDDTYVSDDGKLVYKPNGDYEEDLVISDGLIKDYNNEYYDIKKLIKRFGV